MSLHHESARPPPRFAREVCAFYDSFFPAGLESATDDPAIPTVAQWRAQKAARAASVRMGTSRHHIAKDSTQTRISAAKALLGADSDWTHYLADLPPTEIATALEVFWIENGDA